MRAMGGVGIALRCPSATCPPFQRRYGDIDFAMQSHRKAEIEQIFSDAGYTFDREFNNLNANRRLIFWDPRAERKVDVFVERVEMCHVLDLKDRLALDPETLTLADLLLLKLQIVEVSDKDFTDALTLLADHPIDSGGIDGAYVAEFLARDWGWWRTSTTTLGRLLSYLPSLPGFAAKATVEGRIRALMTQVEAAPRSRRWKLRARIGERARWYELPEEVE